MQYVQSVQYVLSVHSRLGQLKGHKRLIELKGLRELGGTGG